MQNWVKILVLLSATATGWSFLLCQPQAANNRHASLSTRFAGTNEDPATKLDGLKVAIVGGGPSGLLLSHRLLQGGASQVSLYESRGRPTFGQLTSRAYALGIGIRGRTAIQSVDNGNLWQAVKQAGFLSERFQFHAGPLTIALRSEKDAKNIRNYEPSLLAYQSELCRVLTDELEQQWTASGKLQVNFDTKVEKVDLEARTLTTSKSPRAESYDVIVGCDGVKSIVRQAMQDAWNDFEATAEVLPGEFKVVRLPQMPPALDPTAVALILPSAGTITAFVEPTAKGQACVLFAGNNSTDTLFTSTNITELKTTIAERYPKLAGADLDEAAAQLVATPQTSKAGLVKCNIYHMADVAVLVGDAAHATGGVSGQGVNSALMDAAALADSLLEHYDATSKFSSLRQSLLEYSKHQVAEGEALYDLSFGPKPTSAVKRITSTIAKALDFIFKGKFGLGRQPLQTKLTTSLESFADIRRDLDPRYEEKFPTSAEWAEAIAALDAKAPSLVKST